MSKVEINRIVNNVKVKFINVPSIEDKEYGYLLEPKTIEKLENFEKLIKSDLCYNNMSIEVDYEKPYHATGYDWIPPSFKCIRCGKTYEVADMIQIIVDNKKEWVCREC